METAIGISKSPNIELVKYHLYWKGKNLRKKTSDLWTCNLVYHLIKGVKRNIIEIPLIFFFFCKAVLNIQ